jgi:hypothetical protein
MSDQTVDVKQVFAKTTEGKQLIRVDSVESWANMSSRVQTMRTVPMH